MRAASIAIWAVSRSRISPIITMSGSQRRIERRPAAKVSPAFGLTCTWLMPGQPVLDRVLDRDDVLVGRVELVEGAVEGGGLARAGRAGHQDGAVGAPVAGLEAAEHVLAEAELATAAASRWTCRGCG